MWILTGNLLNSRSAQLNELQGNTKIDDIIKYILDTNDPHVEVIGKIEHHYKKLDRTDLDITIFVDVDCIDALRESLEFYLQALELSRIDTVVLVNSLGNLYTDAEKDMTRYLEMYKYLQSQTYIDSIGVFELSPLQLDFLEKHANLPKYNYIQLEYCCVPPQHLVKYCLPKDIEILSMDKFEVKDAGSLGLDHIKSTMRYIMNIKSRSVCTHQGYIVKAAK